MAITGRTVAPMTGDMSPSGELDARNLRASHEDRDRVIELLRVAAGDGRLTGEELDERIEVAFSARTYGELAKLTADLPAAGPVPVPAPSASAPAAAKDVVRIAVGSGHATRDGRWVVPRRLEVRVQSGHVKLDLTRAVIGHPETQVDLQLGSGHVLIVTRPGIWVDADDLELGSGRARNRAPWRPDVPACPSGEGFRADRQRALHRAAAPPVVLALAAPAAAA
jgi:hypothetical protein